MQGFPQEFKLPDNISGAMLYHQAGNSVTVPVVQRIAENMMNVLNPMKQIEEKTSTGAIVLRYVPKSEEPSSQNSHKQK